MTEFYRLVVSNVPDSPLVEFFERKSDAIDSLKRSAAVFPTHAALSVEFCRIENSKPSLVAFLNVATAAANFANEGLVEYRTVARAKGTRPVEEIKANEETPEISKKGDELTDGFDAEATRLTVEFSASKTMMDIFGEMLGAKTFIFTGKRGRSHYYRSSLTAFRAFLAEVEGWVAKTEPGTPKRTAVLAERTKLRKISRDVVDL